VKTIKKVPFCSTFSTIECLISYYLSLSSEDAESRFLPFALREARTLLPLAVDILSLNPCLFAFFLLDG
jgi:hypothetical protein